MSTNDLSTSLTEAIAVAATHEVVAARAEHLEFQPNLNLLLGGALMSWNEMSMTERAEKIRQADAARKRKYRQAQARSTETERKETTPPSDPARLRACLGVVGTLSPLISKVVTAKYNKVRRVLGDTEREDIAMTVCERLGNSLANSKFELLALAEAALYLIAQPGIPNLPKRKSDDVPFAARAVMGAIGRISRFAIVDAYRAHPDWASLEYLQTMGEQIRSVDDVLIERMTASRKPHFASKPPGQPDARGFAQMVIDVAIDQRGLRWLSELVENNLDSGGHMAWTLNADAIWEGFELPPMLTDSPTLRAECAKQATRQAFEYLPDVVRRAYEIVNDPAVMWEIKHQSRAVWQPSVARTMDDTLAESAFEGVALIPRLDTEMRDLHNGKRFFLEGMEDGDAPVKLYDGPGPDEWKKVRKVVDSPLVCNHGQRKQVFGTTKKANKWPRPWSGHFCAEKGESACEPIFGKAPTPTDQAVNAMEEIG